MEENVSNLLLVYGAALFMVVLFIWRARAPKSQAVLNLKKTTPLKDRVEMIEIERQETPLPMQFAHDAVAREEKVLNVIFNYNGHSWDAFEVLGLPAGSAKDKVDEAYQKALNQVDKQSRVFIEMAYKAICTKLYPLS